MDPSSEKTPALALPSPATEYGTQADGALSPGAGGHEAAPAGPELAASPQAPAAAVPLPPVSSNSPTAAATNPSQSAPAPDPAAATANDHGSVTALDEEWINKAKAIVERTKTDPYIESRELGKAKADYLRIRYNKQVKVAEDAPR